MPVTEMNLPDSPEPTTKMAGFPNYNSGPALRSFLDGRGLSIRKQWGQNFLINPRARHFLVDALEAENGAAVWEIGSGLGCMTHELLGRKLKITAFEIDPGLCSVLEELFAAWPDFTLIRGDVLKTWKTTERAPYLLGNLPYTVAAVLLGNLITDNCFFSRMIITVQKEVALRMAAKPGSKEYSSISVLCSSAYTMKIIMTLKGQSFYPVPRVDSAVVCFERLPNVPLPPPLFYPLLRSLFASRRKTIANNLLNFISRSCILNKTGTAAAIAEDVLKSCGLTGGERAEKLPCGTFLALASGLENCISCAGTKIKEGS
ncbi:MAG: 16S rRNA (adenine(1518)-N(6)/adenine(1519)-N(6))-dimethyltransferase RsmA [Treponema sp.]|nr:16S rRNA (adenine(1518)-N(6)/adenine(1519)-N(6))-dimethyltransferase RsmA [Treponema sp.]